LVEVPLMMAGGLALIRYLLLFVVVVVALKTNDEGRREAALAVLRVLRPGLLPRKPDPGSS
jgi:hypothetical protein